MKVVILLLTTLLLMACKTKKVVSDFESQKELTEYKKGKDSISNVSKFQEKETISKKETTEKQQENETEIEVKGKAEIDKPLEIYNIKNGDTLQGLKVVGNAEVSFFSKSKLSESVKREKIKDSISLNENDIVQIKAAENINKKKVSENRKKSKSAATKTGTFWSFGLIGIFGAVALILIALLIYFKRK